MDENPYQRPAEASTERSPATGRATGYWPPKSTVGLSSVMLGASFSALLASQTAEWDDTGGKQMSVRAIIGFVIYHFLF
jgi:hypothetical protein